MKERKYLDCIICPLSCKLTIELENGIIQTVTGNACPRGEKYAQEELTAPKRMLTSTVKINGAILPLLPVVSAMSLPKDKIMDCAIKLRDIVVDAPIQQGDVVLPDILALGVDIVAARSMDKI